MNIEGLDYNSQRERLVLPEYGRAIQNMVEYCMTLPTKAERQQCAETIVAIMDRMFPENRGSEDNQHKLWDNLAIMSHFQLDIDFPFDVSEAAHMAKRPDPLSYPTHKIPVRHYGQLVFEMLEKLKSMPEGPERDELICMTANQMKRNLVQWSHSSADNEKVADDMARYTDGKIQLDLENFKFAAVPQAAPQPTKNNKRRK